MRSVATNDDLRPSALHEGGLKDLNLSSECSARGRIDVMLSFDRVLCTRED